MSLVKTSRAVLINVLGVGLFMSLPVIFSTNREPSLELFRELFGYALTVVFFYVNVNYLISGLYFRRKYLIYGLFIVLSFTTIVMLPPVVFQFSKPPNGPLGQVLSSNNGQPEDIDFLEHIDHNLFTFSAMLFVSFALAIRRRLKTIETEKLNAELAYLKAQINPHFLFNTLNSIYALAIDKSDETPTAVVKLSGMMRYVLQDAEREFVPMTREMEYLSDYIDLQQIRWNYKVDVNLMIKGDQEGKRIAPLILQPFVENAFKHGVSSDAPSSISVLIAIHKNALTFIVENRKLRRNVSENDRSGIGIDNTKQRLALIYPGSHKLQIQDQDEKFKVSLSIKLR